MTKIIITLLALVTLGATQLPPPPVVPCNVTSVGLPNKSLAIGVSNIPQDYIALKIVCTKANPDAWEHITCWKSGDTLPKSNCTQNGYQRNCYESAWCLGVRNNYGAVYSHFDFYCNAKGESPGTVLLTPSRYPNMIEKGTLVWDQDYWSLVQQAHVPAGVPYNMSVLESYGVSETTGQFLSDSVGISTVNYWGTYLYGYTVEMSTKLSAIFSPTTIDEYATPRKIYQFNATSANQVVGVYQLRRVYSTHPSSQFKAQIDEWNESRYSACISTMQCSCYELEMPSTYTYSANTFLQVYGVDEPCDQ